MSMGIGAAGNDYLYNIQQIQKKAQAGNFGAAMSQTSAEESAESNRLRSSGMGACATYTASGLMGGGNAGGVGVTAGLVDAINKKREEGELDEETKAKLAGENPADFVEALSGLSGKSPAQIMTELLNMSGVEVAGLADSLAEASGMPPETFTPMLSRLTGQTEAMLLRSLMNSGEEDEEEEKQKQNAQSQLASDLKAQGGLTLEDIFKSIDVSV